MFLRKSVKVQQTTVHIIRPILRRLGSYLLRTVPASGKSALRSPAPGLLIVPFLGSKRSLFKVCVKLQLEGGFRRL